MKIKILTWRRIMVIWTLSMGFKREYLKYLIAVRKRRSLKDGCASSS
jgi:hypothetical protein